MDRFPDGLHVWLRSTLRGAYLFADDDGSGVSLSTCGATMNSAWQVQRAVSRDGTRCFFLQSAAYGRYLALSPYSARHGHRGRRAMLRDFREPHQRNIRWRAIAAEEGSDGVLLCTLEDRERYLRAHDRSTTCSCVTVDGRLSTMMHWTVVQIPPRPAPPVLPTPSTDLAGREGRPDLERMIRCMRANDVGHCLGTKTFTLKFSGRSVFDLTKEVAMKVRADMSSITLCVQAGFYGRLTPLVVDLPCSEDHLDIVVLPTSSPDAKAMVHPDIDPSPPGIDLLTDGAFVRLKCWLHGRDCYLHAKEDGIGVNLRPEATSLQEVWAVHLLEIDGDEFLLFRSTAYGRYFALMEEGKKAGSRFAQVNYEVPEQSNLLWLATSLKGSNEINLRNGNGDISLDVRWTVEAVPMSTTPPLPVPAPAATTEHKRNTDEEPPEGPERIIWYRRENDINMRNRWATFLFTGQSLSDLKSKLSNDNSLILCIRAGHCGQLTPLMTDLPINDETMEVIILTPGSQVAQELRFPVVNPRDV